MRSVFLSAGHSTTDPGAVGTTFDARGRQVPIKEADIAVEVRNIVAFYLSQMKVRHTVDGTGTVNLPLDAAVRLAKKSQIAVEFHCNAATTRTAAGVETLSNDRDKALGAQLCTAVAGVMGTKNRGAKGESEGHHHRLAFVQAGGIILELFFISNPAEVATYQAKKWLLGKAIAEVLAQAAAA